MDKNELYETLRAFTSPVVAITTTSETDYNGMISNSAIRASILPDCPRIAFYCFKQHYSHELIESSKLFCLHLLHRDQLNVVEALGFDSGRNRDKLCDLDYEKSENDLPIIRNSAAYFECEVVNGMDAGPSTFYLGNVVESKRADNFENLELMDSTYLRDMLSPELMQKYRENKERVRECARKQMDVDPSYEWNSN